VIPSHLPVDFSVGGSAQNPVKGFRPSRGSDPAAVGYGAMLRKQNKTDSGSNLEGTRRSMRVESMRRRFLPRDGAWE
jgi:hypothetical protein